MPATLYLDKPFEHAELEDDQFGIIRCVRPAIVTGIDVQATGSDPMALVRALATAGLPQIPNAHPADPNCRVVRHKVRGMAGNQAEVLCFYERPIVSDVMPIGRWFLNSNSALCTIQSQLVPGTYEPIRVRFNPDGLGTPGTIEKTGTASMEYPLVRIQATGLFYGLNVGAPWRLAVGAVSEAGFLGFDRGYWKFDELRDEIVRIDLSNTDNALYRYTAIFSSKLVEHWSQTEVMRLPTGDFVSLPADVQNNLRQRTYVGQFCFQQNGATAVDPYRVVDFATLMGIF